MMRCTWLLLGSIAVAFVTAGCGPGDGGCNTFQCECSAPTGGPTTHSSDITVSETWAAANSPHQVTGSVDVYDGATLTIEPCAVVELGDGVSLDVVAFAGAGGVLTAEGLEFSEILFTAMTGATWKNIRVQSPASASIAHARIESGGSDDLSYDGASLVVYGSALPFTGVLRVDNVRIEGSAGYGALVGRYGGFTSDSAALTITGSGATSPTHLEPIFIDAPSMGSIPSGTYTGNAIDQIHVDTNAGIQDSITVPDVGSPYWLDGSLAVFEGSQSTAGVPTLTLEAGVEMRFGPDATLRVGFNVSAGRLVINGTSTNPVVLTSSAPTPAAGDWTGIWFNAAPGTATNSVTNARIEYAGGSAIGSRFTCFDRNLYTEQSAITFHFQPATSPVTNTTIFQSGGHGFVRGYEADIISPDFKATNTFSGLLGCEQTNPKDTANSCTGRDTSCG